MMVHILEQTTNKPPKPLWQSDQFTIFFIRATIFNMVRLKKSDTVYVSSKSYSWFKRKVKNKSKIYMGQEVAPVWKLWQNDTHWCGRIVAHEQR